MKMKSPVFRAVWLGVWLAVALALCLLLPAPVQTVAHGQGGGRPTATPTPKPRPRSTPRPVPRATPRPTPRPAPTPKATPVETPAPRQPAPDAETVLWETVKDSPEAGDVQVYLRRYPNGRYAGQARQRVSELQAAAKKSEAPPPRRQAQSFSENVNGVQLEMVLIPAGTFTMGSPDAEAERGSDEGPQHRVSVGQFYMGKYEVTQAQWRAVMGTNPSRFKGDNLPVENVSWNEAVEFCRKLTQMSGREYRLPTEAEWEYAARAGTTTPFAFGSSLSSEQANFDGNYPYGGAAKGVYRQQTTAVGSFQPNGFGLYDMHGNVWEWCQDWYHENYNGAPSDGSAWESGGEQQYRVLRGGSWNDVGYFCRSAIRYGLAPGVHSGYFGFRVVVSART